MDGFGQDKITPVKVSAEEGRKSLVLLLLGVVAVGLPGLVVFGAQHWKGILKYALTFGLGLLAGYLIGGAR